MMHCAHLIAHTYVGCHLHKAWIPPAPTPLPAPLPHIAVDTLLGLTIKAVYSSTVKGPFGIQMVGAGNDSGWIVPHLCIPPANVLVPVHILLGGSKPMFSASTVVISTNQGPQPTAAVVLPYNFVSFNQACSDPCNMPIDAVISPNNVTVGLTLGDFAAGLANLLIDSAISGLCNKYLGRVTGALGNKIAAAVGKEALEAFASRVGSAMGQSVARAMASAVVREAVGDLMEGYLGNTIGDGVAALGGRLTEPMGRAIDGREAPSEAPGGRGSTPVHRAE